MKRAACLEKNVCHGIVDVEFLVENIAPYSRGLWLQSREFGAD